MILRVVYANGIVKSFDYDVSRAPQLAKALARYWHTFARVTVTADNVTWIITAR
jgi:hypothetical protein